MMEPQSGTFKELEELANVVGLDKKGLDELRAEIEAREGKPTLHVGEVVEVKGVKFQVQRIREIGVLVLRMVPGQKWPKE